MAWQTDEAAGKLQVHSSHQEGVGSESITQARFHTLCQLSPSLVQTTRPNPFQTPDKSPLPPVSKAHSLGCPSLDRSAEASQRDDVGASLIRMEGEPLSRVQLFDAIDRLVPLVHNLKKWVITMFEALNLRLSSIPSSCMDRAF